MTLLSPFSLLLVVELLGDLDRFVDLVSLGTETLRSVVLSSSLRSHPDISDLLYRRALPEKGNGVENTNLSTDDLGDLGEPRLGAEAVLDDLALGDRVQVGDLAVDGRDREEVDRLRERLGSSDTGLHDLRKKVDNGGFSSASKISLTRFSGELTLGLPFATSTLVTKTFASGFSLKYFVTRSVTCFDCSFSCAFAASIKALRSFDTCCLRRSLRTTEMTAGLSSCVTKICRRRQLQLESVEARRDQRTTSKPLIPFSFSTPSSLTILAHLASISFASRQA